MDHQHSHSKDHKKEGNLASHEPEMYKNNKHEEPNPKPPKHDHKAPTQTLPNGHPIDNNAFSLTAGENGPLLLTDLALIEKLAHFDRERIPERVVHAKGVGVFGYFEVTKDITKYCKAKIFSEVGKRTPVFTRFSRVTGESGAADSERDVRGFAVKFYTEEGNWDIVGNNTPVFFHRDPIKFVDLIHSQKRNPKTNLRDQNAAWDFLSQVPESVHMVTMLYSDRGTPKGYRHMHGFGNHTFKMVNAKGEVFYVKFHLITNQGIKNLTDEKARLLYGDPDYYNRDLYNAIDKGKNPSWALKIQVMPVAEAVNYKWNVLDVTKIWPHADYPLIEVGQMVLNKNPENYFAETEQSAFSPANLIPGIEASEDRMLQSRLFSYNDTQRYRLGVNYFQIPINCPFRTRIANDQRDGFMVVNGGQGSRPPYEPNSYHAYAPDPQYTASTYQVTGLVQRHGYTHPNSDFEQTGNLYRKILNDKERENLVHNIAVYLGRAEKMIQERMVELFRKCDPDYGHAVAKALAVAESNGSLLDKAKKKIRDIAHSIDLVGETVK